MAHPALLVVGGSLSTPIAGLGASVGVASLTTAGALALAVPIGIGVGLMMARRSSAPDLPGDRYAGM